MPPSSSAITLGFWLACLGLFIAAANAAEIPADADDELQASSNNDTSSAVSDAFFREFMQLYTVTHVDELAVCNDGSPGAYYHRPGAADNSTRWVIRFLGGAWCWDRHSCAARNVSTPYLMSTFLLPDRTSAHTSSSGVPNVVLQSHGITSIDVEQNPDFHSWNHVHVWYCSSDSHLGDTSPGDGSEFAGWHFRGRRIAVSVINHLLAQHGLSEATHVLLTGDSAGGVGVMNLADDISDILRDEAPNLETFKLFVDAGWFLDIPPYANRSDGMTFEKCARTLATSYGAAFDRTCEQHYGGSESWQCFFAYNCQSFLETPALFHEYLYDSANLGYDGAGSSAEAEDFRSRMEASLKASAEASSAGAAWNGSCGNWTTDEAVSTDEARSAGNGHQAMLGNGVQLSSKLMAVLQNSERSDERAPREQDSDGTGVGERSVNLAERTGDSRQSKAAVSKPAMLENAQSASSSRTPLRRFQADAGVISNGSMTCSGQAPLQPNIFAPACQLHEMIDSVLFTTSHVRDVRFVDMLGAWFAGDVESVYVVDGHQGVIGGDECGFDPAAAQQLAAVVTVGL